MNLDYRVFEVINNIITRGSLAGERITLSGENFKDRGPEKCLCEQSAQPFNKNFV